MHDVYVNDFIIVIVVTGMKVGQAGSSNMLDDTNRKREVRLMKNRYKLDPGP